MDIALMSMALNHSKVQQQASILVMKKAMGNVEQQGEALQKLISTVQAIQYASQPYLGGNIDLKV